MFILKPQPAIGFDWTEPSASVGPVLECAALAAVAAHLFTSAHLTLKGDPEEWAVLSEALDVGSSDIRLVRQVHRAAVAVVGRKDDAPWPTPEADVIVSDDPGVVIGVRVADCAPILLADPTRAAVGAVHAGWRGTVQSAAIAGVEAMCREFGSRPADLIVAIGPCLGVCCGEVGEEVPVAFRAAGHDARSVDRWFSIGPGGRHHLHLARANADQIEGAGVRPSNIHVAGLCTRSHPDVFHSYRAAGPNAGRMTALIRSRPKG